ncbi:hypothetical protein B7463_g7415, partial [Scytalidium lignicola]
MKSFSVNSFLIATFLAKQCLAHFLLHSPATVGFDDDKEGTAPCGGFSVDFSKDNVSNFHVGGDAIALTSTHLQSTWLFRATLDKTRATNWTDLLPAVLQSGLGAYCQKTVIVPASWAGSKGVIGIVQDAPDGLLYQCSAVNFVAGTFAPPSVCTNATGLTASFTTDTTLSSLPAIASATAPPSVQSSPSGTSASSSTSKPSAATSLQSNIGLAPFSWAIVVVLAICVAYLL